MNRKPYPITELTGGIDVSKDPILLLDKSSITCTNVRFDQGIVKKDWALTPYTTLPVLGIPMYMETYWKEDGTSYQVFLTTTSAYVYNSTTKEWDDYTLGTLVDNCEAAWTASANVTSTADASVYKVGSKSAKHVIADAFATGLASYYNFGAKNLTTYTHIHLWVQSSVTTTAGQLRLYLDEHNNCVSPLEELQIPALTAGVWTRVSLVLAAPAACGAIISIGLKVHSDIGVQTVYIDDVRAVKEFTGSTANRFCTATMNDTFIVTNGKDAMQKFTGTSIALLAGSPPLAKYIFPFMSHLCAVGTTELGTSYPRRVRWTDVGTIETWTGGTSGSVDLNDTADWCIAGKVLGGKAFVIKESSIWDLVYVGGTTVFDPKPFFDSTGTNSPDSIYYFGQDEIFFKGNVSYYRFNGQRREDFGEAIFNWLYKTGEMLLSLDKGYTIAGIVVDEASEYWSAVPFSASTPNVILKYNTKTKAWTKSNAISINAFSYTYSPTAAVTWDTAVGSWDAAIGSWQTKALAGSAPITLLAKSDGTVWQDDRSSTDTSQMVFETKDFIFGHETRIPYFMVFARYGGFTAYYSKDGGLTWSSGQTFAYAADWDEFQIPVDETVKTFRVKLISTATQFEIRWIEPWYIPRTRSSDILSS